MEKFTREQAEILVNNYKTWHQSFEIYPGIITPGAYSTNYLWDMMEVPDNLNGLRALDVGSCDGFFSRELHKRGADVISLDYKTKNFSGFSIMEKLYGKPMKHLNINISDIRNHNLGTFDIILCLGVLYHLPDPVRCLWDLRQICCGELWIETYIEDFEINKPVARYYKYNSLSNDITNFWAPNMECANDILEDTGFEVIKSKSFGDRGLFRANIQQKKLSDFYKMQLCYGLLKTEYD